MTTKKYRVDFVARKSIVVQIREDEDECEAIRIAEEIANRNSDAFWEYEDEGIEEVSQDEEAENEIYDDDF